MAAPVNTKLFAGDEWEVRAKGNGGPGSNLWDDTHAHVDDNGWLHLKRTTCNFSHFVACTIWRRLSSPFQGASPAKTRASSRPSRVHGPHLRPSTQCEKLRGYLSQSV